jgi:type I restriction enzyme S subunit
MKWAKVKIGEIKASAKKSLVGGPFGSDLTSRHYVDDGVPVIRGGNLPNDRIFFDDEFVFVSESKADELSANLAFPGDVVFTQRGTLGQVGLIPDDSRFPRYVISQSQMKLTVDQERVDPKFVFYFFRHPSTVQNVKNRGITSGVPHINLGILRDFEIPLPPLSVQKEIVSILTAYDDLIENNRRRMALLEESARLLYREWFVRLRFPGHEHTRIVNGVPEGWRWETLESVCAEGDGIQTGPFGSQLHQSDYTEEGVPVVMPKNLIGFRISVEDIARIPEDLADKLGRHRMIPGDTVYGRRGDIGRRAFISSAHKGWFCGTGSLRIRPNPKEINPRYLFDTLGSPATSGTIASRAKGSTMLNLNAGVLKTVPVLIPRFHLQDLYGDHIESTADMIEILAQQNQKLRTARDLLLPKLMSGEIEV